MNMTKQGSIEAAASINFQRLSESEKCAVILQFLVSIRRLPSRYLPRPLRLEWPEHRALATANTKGSAG